LRLDWTGDRSGAPNKGIQLTALSVKAFDFCILRMRLIPRPVQATDEERQQ
jgi:hypothetical protein